MGSSWWPLHRKKYAATHEDDAHSDRITHATSRIKHARNTHNHLLLHLERKDAMLAIARVPPSSQPAQAVASRLAQARRHAARRADAAERAAEMRSLLSRCRVVFHDRRLELHAPVQFVQDGFAEIVCCEASHESKLVSRWLADATELGDEATAAAVLDFTARFARQVAAEYGVAEYLQRIELCTARLLFRRLHPLLFPAMVERNATRDRQLRQQQRRLQGLPASAVLGDAARELLLRLERASPESEPSDAVRREASGALRVAGERVAPDSPLALPEPPPRSRGRGEGAVALPNGTLALAVAALSDLSYHSVPADMLLCIHRCVDLLHRAIPYNAGASQDAAVGADELVPLLVLAAVHAELPHAFASIEYARLCTEDQLNSELGYCLACAEAAFSYLESLEPHATGDASGQGAAGRVTATGGNPAPDEFAHEACA